jgi:hypothetical protein
VRFPSVSGSNLERDDFDLPGGFQGSVNVLLIAFQRWQQSLIDTWIPFVAKLERTHPYVRYYELPTIQKMNHMSRWFINEGMRAGIPDPEARQRTITLYVDKVAFREALDLPSEDDIYVLLVDQEAEVRWRSAGALNKEKGQSLMAALEAVFQRAPQSEGRLQ